jgi:signal transduction histidine kinase
MNLSDVLSKLPFFSDLPSDYLTRLVDVGGTEKLKSGKIVFNQGDPPDGLYTIVSGSVKVFLTDQENREVELASLEKGDFFGEMALLDGEPRSASVSCLEDCEFFVLGRSAFLDLMRSFPPLLEGVLQDLSRRVRGTQEKFYWEMLNRQQTESRMELARQRSLSQMVAGVAHEVNTPLGIVNSAASVVDELINDPALIDGEPDEVSELITDLKEASLLIQNNISRASQLIQRFKNLSFHQIAETREVVALDELIEEIIGLFRIEAKKSNIIIEFDSFPEDAGWEGFPGYLSQIMLNLLMNAKNYAFPDRQQGRITVELANESDDAFLLTVSDDGCGIPAENVAHIFEPFFTTGRSTGGTGLGLSIVYNLVRDSLGGKITVDSSSAGTRFSMTLPKVAPVQESER